MYGFEVANMFKTENHLRVAEKCCLNCRFGEADWEGVAICTHPSLDYTDEDGEQQHAEICARQCDVCDLWEPEPKRRKGGKK